MVTYGWIKDIWLFIHEFHISLLAPKYLLTRIQHHNDGFLIPWFHSLGASYLEIALKIVSGCQHILSPWMTLLLVMVYHDFIIPSNKSTIPLDLLNIVYMFMTGLTFITLELIWVCGVISIPACNT